MSLPNAQYNVASAESIPVRIAAYQRRRMFKKFMEFTRVSDSDSVVDIGATSDRSYESSNYFESWYPCKSRVTAVGIDDAAFLEEEYPGMKFVRADGRDLPFEDRTFDVVHSSAVIEHVGSFDEQVRFAAECGRVARRAIFLTTPNRWFPVEFHTVLPLVHWMPKPWFRQLMRVSGRSFFADENNLNLLGAADLARVADRALPADRFVFEVGAVTLGGWPSNLLLKARRITP
jgi:hypothetical protein